MIRVITNKQHFESLIDENDERNTSHYYNLEGVDFPCIVEYSWKDQHNGPYYYDYDFHNLDELGLVMEEE